MRKSSAILLNLSIFLTAVTSFAQTPPIQTELGFKRINDPSTPPALRALIPQSVFEMRALAVQDESDMITIDLNSPRYAQLQQKLATATGDLKLDRIVIEKQIEYCRRRNLIKECTVIVSNEKGTAFLAGRNGATLWTNAHLVDKFLQMRARNAGKSVYDLLQSDARVAIFLFDLNGRLVFDPFVDSAAVFAYIPPTQKMLNGGYWADDNSDMVGIQLGREIGRPLTIAKLPPANTLVYRPGFPACTGCGIQTNVTDPALNNARGQAKDSNGEGLFWSAGQLQALPTVYQFLGVNLGSLQDIRNMVFFTADSQVGMSGGPILLPTGEVVGIFAGSKARMFGAKLLVLARGVRPPMWN